MKHSARASVGVVTLCLLTLVRTDEKSDLLVNKSRMHDVVQTMLGFREAPQMPYPTHSAESAPKYMLDLYERFKDRPISKGQAEGNTVRSIQAKIGR